MLYLRFCVGVEPNSRIEKRGLFLALLFLGGCGSGFFLGSGFLFLGHSRSQPSCLLQMKQIKIVSEI